VLSQSFLLGEDYLRTPHSEKFLVLKKVVVFIEEETFFESNEKEIISNGGSGESNNFHFQQYDQSLFINPYYPKKYIDKYIAKGCMYSLSYYGNSFRVSDNQEVRNHSHNAFRRIVRFSVLMPMSEISKYSSF